MSWQPMGLLGRTRKGYTLLIDPSREYHNDLFSTKKELLLPGIKSKRVSGLKSCFAALSREMYYFELAAWKLF